MSSGSAFCHLNNCLDFGLIYRFERVDPAVWTAFLPIIKEVGVDPIHFGILFVLVLMIGLLTPPFGVSLFMLKRMSTLSTKELVQGIMPFMIPMLVVVLLVILVPQIVTWIPTMF